VPQNQALTAILLIVALAILILYLLRRPKRKSSGG
jgi:preprotein translocase subunit YajC